MSDGNCDHGYPFGGTGCPECDVPHGVAQARVRATASSGERVTDEGVRCVICGREHSGVDVNDSPTTHCEVCEPVIARRSRSEDAA